MQTGKTTPPAGAAFLLAGNKPVSPVVLSVKQAPAGAAGGVVIAVDGKRTKYALAAVAERGASSDGALDPKELSGVMIKKAAEETSSLLRSLHAPDGSTFPEQVSFSKEVEALQKTCDAIVEAAGFFHEDRAITMLIGVQARVNLLLNTNKQSPQDLLFSSMVQIKASVDAHMYAQEATTKPMASSEAARKTISEIVESSGLQPAPTVCSEEEVRMVLEKTLALFESEPVNSTRGKAGLFFRVRSSCRSLLEEVDKNGIDDMTSVAIVVIHAMAIAVLGQHKKYFNYDDVADDSLMSSLRRLEVAVRDYMLEGPSAAEDSD